MVQYTEYLRAAICAAAAVRQLWLQAPCASRRTRCHVSTPTPLPPSPPRAAHIQQHEDTYTLVCAQRWNTGRMMASLMLPAHALHAPSPSLPASLPADSHPTHHTPQQRRPPPTPPQLPRAPRPLFWPHLQPPPLPPPSLSAPACAARPRCDGP